MEKKSWLWKRKSSDRSPGETSESSGSTSSHSERYSDEQEPVKGSPNHTPSPEVNSKLGVHNEEVNDSVKSLTEKLSAALVNVGAKEDLVKQHAKVAEEAVAGWEKAENEVASLKQQFEAAVQQNLSLEVRVNHLDSALKECVRQLRQAREEQEKRIHKAVAEKANEWEFTKLELESQLLELQNQAEAAKAKCAPAIDPNVLLKLEGLERENSILKHELLSLSEELEVRTIERDLSTHAAEMSSKQQLESIKKVAKLEAECRRLQAQLGRKSSLTNDHKAVSTSSFYVDSLTDSQSDSGERLNSLEVDTRKLGKVEHSESEPSCSDSWASALIAELDQFKSGNALTKIVPSSSVEIDIMDDFLEMERLAALPEANNKTHGSEVENAEHLLRAELEILSHRVAELEDRLGKVEAEKAELENALNISQESLKASKALLEENYKRMEDLQKELTLVNESKELLVLQLVGMETEARAMSTKVDSLKAEVERERSSSAEMIVKCQELEKELTRKTGEIVLQHSASSNGELKVKQEELSVVAANRLAECQKTISSLATQLKSLATLEDFLIDTANLLGFSAAEGSQTPRVSGGESWNLHYNNAFMPKSNPDSSRKPIENSPPAALMNGNTESPPSSSSSTSSVVSLNHVSSAKTKNGFGKLFSRSKSGIQLENH